MTNLIGMEVVGAGLVSGLITGAANGFITSYTGKRYSDGIYGLLG